LAQDWLQLTRLLDRSRALEKYGALMFNDPPVDVIIFWAVGSLSAVSAIAVSLYSIKRQKDAAKNAGFGNEELLWSYGPRGDRVISVLFLPVVFSLLFATQMFVPNTMYLMEFLRQVLCSLALYRLVELFFLFNGGQKTLLKNLPEEPVRAFANPPFCCMACSVKVGFGHLRVLMYLLYQMVFLFPVIGIVKLYIVSIYPGEFEQIVLALTIAMLVSCMFGQYGATCLAKLMEGSYTTRATSSEGLDASLQASQMAGWVMTQELQGLLTGILTEVGPEPSGASMTSQEYIGVIVGFAVCLLQLILAVWGIWVFKSNNTELMYPKVEKSVFPLDSLALLDMNGVSPAEWTGLAAMQKKELGSSI